MEGESREDGSQALSWKIMSVLSQVESRDEDERTRYEITRIKGRVKSRARTGHRRNRNITIGINSVPRSVSLHHLLFWPYLIGVPPRFSILWRIGPAKINRRCAIKILYENCFDRKLPAAPRDGNNYAISENACAQLGEGFCQAISSGL